MLEKTNVKRFLPKSIIIINVLSLALIVFGLFYELNDSNKKISDFQKFDIPTIQLSFLVSKFNDQSASIFSSYLESGDKKVLSKYNEKFERLSWTFDQMKNFSISNERKVQISILNDRFNQLRKRQDFIISRYNKKNKSQIPLWAEEYQRELDNFKLKVDDLVIGINEELDLKITNKEKRVGHFYVILLITSLVFALSLVILISKFKDNVLLRLEAENKLMLEEKKVRDARQAQLASMGKIAAGVGHEINNPLAIAIGFIKKLERDLKDLPSYNETHGQNIEKINISLDRVTNIVKGLKNFSRLEEDYDQIVNVDDVLSSTINLVKEIFKHDGVVVSLELDSTTPCILGNQAKLQQTIMILLTNAKDALDGVQEAKIEVKSSIIANKVSISVSDNGAGIPDEIRDKIFESFFTTKPVGQGTGIGLGLLNNIVKNMNGKIDLDSSVGSGSTFTISFPISEILSVESPEDEAETGSSVHELSRQKIIPKESTRVLLVDDEEDIRFILEEIVSVIDFEADHAENGEQALQMIKENKYDFVFTDMKMPIMCGDELVLKAKEINDYPTVYFMITGGPSFDESGEDNKRLLQLVDEFIDKPFDTQTIYNLIEKHQKLKSKKSA